MTSNLILSGSESPISRRMTRDASLQKQKTTKSPRKSSSLPTETVDYLKAWMMSPEHIAHPYPTEQEKAQIMDDTGIELKQLTNWFVNNRKRYWKPRVEARLQQQAAVAAVSPTKIVQAASTVTPYIALDMTKPPQVSVSPSPSQHTRDGTSVNMVNASAFVSFDRSRSPRAVSIGSSSFASESDNASLSNDTDDDLTDDIVDEVDADSQMVKRTETVDVHILRPTGDDPLPTLEDVSILANVPSDRIMQSYDGCTLSYRFPVEGFSDQKKVSSKTLDLWIRACLLDTTKSHDYLFSPLHSGTEPS